jgi:FkbM family methyltransferase
MAQLSVFPRLNRFLARPDVKENFIKASAKRLLWRLHWVTTKRPYVIPFKSNLKISIPKTGSGSLIYYQGYSERETADFMMRFLRPGMTLIDIGAHIGEYTLLAAHAVGESGQVHGFEPQPGIFPILRDNVQMNRLRNVTLNCKAVSNSIGEVEFEVFSEPSISSIRKQVASASAEQLVKVATISLDVYWSQQDAKIDLIKVDVEGAEKLVFEGAEGLMSLPASTAPVWLFEYSPSAYAGFGYLASDLLNLLSRHNYQVWQYEGDGKITDFDPSIPVTQIINLIAAKDKNELLKLIQSESVRQKRSYTSV